MLKEIKVGDKMVPMVVNAATPIRYRNLFGRDLLTKIYEGSREGGVDLTVASEVAPELAFIMAKAADKSDMNALSEELYLKWLEDFGPMDFVNATEDIFNFYYGDQKTTADSKKKAKGQPKES